jgi:hypothetical protein
MVGPGCYTTGQGVFVERPLTSYQPTLAPHLLFVAPGDYPSAVESMPRECCRRPLWGPRGSSCPSLDQARGREQITAADNLKQPLAPADEVLGIKHWSMGESPAGIVGGSWSRGWRNAQLIH